LLAAVFAGLAATATQAQTAYAAGQGSPNSVVLGIPVTASVGAACGFASGAAPNGNYTFADFEAGFSRDTSFILNCNGPSRLAIVSANGGLLTSGTAVSGYANIAPYTVDVRMTGNGGVASDASCPAATLKSSTVSPCLLRGPVTPTVGLELNGPSNGQVGSYVRISAPIYAGSNVLVASNAYADTLTITLGASL